MLELIGRAAIALMVGVVAFYAVFVGLLLRGGSLEDVPWVIVKGLCAAAVAAALALLLTGCASTPPPGPEVGRGLEMLRALRAMDPCHEVTCVRPVD